MSIQHPGTENQRDAELGRLGPPTRSVRAMTDRDLLLAGRRARISENRANAERWLCFVEFYRRRLATEDQRRAASPHFALTARQETVVEIGSLWGLDAARVRKQLNVALFLSQHASGIWELCRSGQLDGYRAVLIADRGPPEARRRRGRRPIQHPDAEIPGQAPDRDRLDTQAEPMVTCTVKQLRNAITYALAKVQPARADAEFRKAYAARGAFARDDVPGMGWLSINRRVDQVRLAHRRLTLAARRKREQGDDRTIDQLRADLALDLIIGRTDPAPLPAYARPITNLTVPIQTVMGLSDEPGALSGGTVVPAALARMIAHEPGGTWHRMLTDDAGQMVALSTRSYQPNGPIWRWVVAEQSTCFRPGCDCASTESDLDHRVAWPFGGTDTANLWPGCRTYGAAVS